MLTRRRRVHAPPEAVWAVLADGWLYPLFVVGASSMRAVDPTWPQVGAALHHTVGAWPLTLHDTTSVRAVEPLRRLEVVARGWPAGEAVVVFELEADGAGTLVTLHEDASSGPGRFVPAPLRHAMLAPRNDETLLRLEHLARGRAGLGDPPGTLPGE